MEFHSFARRNVKYLWFVFFAIIFLIVISIKFDSLYGFLKKNPTLLFLSITALLAYKSYFSQRHLTVAKNTIDFQTSFHSSKSVKKAMKYFLTVLIKLDTASLEDMAKRQRSQEIGPKSAREILNSWERVAVAVRNKVYDEEMLYNTYSGFLITVWITLSPYVHKKRLENPKFFVEVEWLATRWKVRKDSSLSSARVRQLTRRLAQVEELLK
ncbi:DUF4760 domain-containing protein, partial [Pseudomonas viridiflava]|uniref:DUF4760 domain-containing protein n=1 Tax=Pseudomonas viridiflava TaxID=33069 RepID=UPI0018E64BA2